jgi:hypothetical protein
LGVQVITSGKDRKILEAMKQCMLNDNTVTRNMNDVLEILTNTTIIEMKTIALENKKRIEQETAQQRQHEQQLQNTQLEAAKETTANQQLFLKTIEDNKNKTKIIVEEIASDGRAASKLGDQQAGFDEISKDAQNGIQNLFSAENIRVKEKAVDNTNGIEQQKLSQKVIELGQKARALDLKEKQIEADKYVATVNFKQ